MDLYSLIGYPLGHSFSADFFNEKFSRENIDASYELWPLKTIEALPDMISAHPDLKGFNVTIPYKKAVLPFLASVSEEAREAGAVNVVKVERNGEGYSLHGYNSDIIGFSRAIAPLIADMRIEPGEALILGSGGAAGAADVALRNLGFTPKFVVRKGSAKVAEDMASRTVTYGELTPQQIFDSRVIVNATPAGMYPYVMAAPPFPMEYIGSRHLVFDMVYNPQETLFMRICRAHGATVCNGLEMLHQQALAAWDIWNSR